MSFPLISIIIFIPLISALIILFMPNDKEKDIKAISLFFSFLPLLLFIPFFLLFDSFSNPFAYEDRFFWIDKEILNTSYYVRADGFNILLVLMTLILSPIIVLGSYKEIKHKFKEFIIAFFLAKCGMLGAFLAYDLLLFFFFWELMLIPIIFIIGIWGSENRIKAATKFFVYTIFGSLFLLISLIYIYIDLSSSVSGSSFWS